MGHVHLEVYWTPRAGGVKTITRIEDRTGVYLTDATFTRDPLAAMFHAFRCAADIERCFPLVKKGGAR